MACVFAFVFILVNNTGSECTLCPPRMHAGRIPAAFGPLCIDCLDAHSAIVLFSAPLTFFVRLHELYDPSVTAGTPIGILRWRAQSKDESAVPLTSTCTGLHAVLSCCNTCFCHVFAFMTQDVSNVCVRVFLCKLGTITLPCY